MRLALLLLAATPLLAAVDGTVINRTTGKPAAGISLALVRPGQNGMTPVGSATADASGRFHFDEPTPAAGPQLVQARYHGISYNKLLTPNMPKDNVNVDVYEEANSAKGVRVTQRLFIFEPNASQVSMNETVVLQNDSNTTFHDTKGGDFRFYLPPAANGQVRVSAQGPGGMPLPSAAEKAEGDIYKINFPIKPGQTQFEINYNLLAGSPMKFQGRIVNVKDMTPGDVRLVAPQGVQLAGKDLQVLGVEPKTQATVYGMNAPDFFSVDISGNGSLRGGGGNAGADESDSPPLHEGQPQIYAHLQWLLVLTFSILGVGLVYLYRTSPNARS